ncbi:Flavonol synthase/flavanone 3-hydroxylase [Panicum miliaceum]|uniref:Flavonol synthase/flavanone 3-hydroxylase n=1 Tax=Panicum miliaceum TaxID=4540 RepID=A0A3L6PKB0_PANMI|nr:Flavonol synthase/flavanone 3-hydroxylase [Panicum miliaceum]
MAETSPRNPPQLTNGELSGGDDVPAMLSSAPEPCFGSGGIPVVDFDVLVNDAADQRAQAIRDLGRACEDWGFFMVINHGVPESLQEAVTEACEELLASPEEEKARYTAAGPMDPNGVDGLEVKHGGRWLLAKPHPGALFVLAGDQLEIVSNEKYKAVVHRAVVGGEKERISFVSMVAPCLDAVVEPVHELAAADGRGVEFRGINAYQVHRLVSTILAEATS